MTLKRLKGLKVLLLTIKCLENIGKNHPSLWDTASGEDDLVPALLNPMNHPADLFRRILVTSSHFLQLSIESIRLLLNSKVVSIQASGLLNI